MYISSILWYMRCQQQYFENGHENWWKSIVIFNYEKYSYKIRYTISCLGFVQAHINFTHMFIWGSQKEEAKNESNSGSVVVTEQISWSWLKVTRRKVHRQNPHSACFLHR